MMTTAEMREQFSQQYAFSPLKFRLAQRGGEMSDANARLIAALDGQEYVFGAQFKSRSTPRIFEESVFRMEKARDTSKLCPLLVVPYLSESQLDELQRRNLSGLDLSGNGVVSVAGKLLVYRCGKPNKFPDSAPTKYAYRGATSLVARTFLCRPAYSSLAEIDSEITARGGSVVLSTISKALKRLEADVIIDRNDGMLCLRQPEKALENLAASYAAPKVTKTITLATQEPLDKLLAESELKSKTALSGRSSIQAYAVMGRQDRPVLFTSNADRLLQCWGKKVEETSRFISFELQQTEDPTVYFDIRPKNGLPYASPIQVFLECMAGDKRDREVATQVQDFILKDLASQE